MRLHTKLSHRQVQWALEQAKLDKHVATDIEFVKLEYYGSQSRDHAFEVQLGTYDKTSGPTNSRHYKNSGSYGATSEYFHGENVWAATYDEWGWFIAEIFAMDPKAHWAGGGGYESPADFHEKTEGKFQEVSA
jgi:hypothetical protein